MQWKLSMNRTNFFKTYKRFDKEEKKHTAVNEEMKK